MTSHLIFTQQSVRVQQNFTTDTEDDLHELKMIPSLNFMIALATNLMNLLHIIRLYRERQRSVKYHWDMPPVPNVMAILSVILDFLRLSQRKLIAAKKKKKAHNVIKLLQHYR